MKKLLLRLKNRRGFTLIELMMVVAVIGILAAVLVPKIGGTKDSAKMAGVESNVRQVQAQVNGLMHRYQDNADELDEALADAIDDEITNPFDNSQKGAVTGASGEAAVVIDEDTDAYTEEGNDDNMEAGQIYVHIQYNSGDYSLEKVVIEPYDNTDSPMPITTITP